MSETLFYPRFRVIVITLINIGPTMLTFGGLVLVSRAVPLLLCEAGGKMFIPRGSRKPSFKGENGR